MNRRADITGLLAGLGALGCAAKPAALPPPDTRSVAGTSVAGSEAGKLATGAKVDTPRDTKPVSFIDEESTPKKTLTVPSCRNDFGDTEAWKAIARAVIAVEHPENHHQDETGPLVEKAKAQTRLLLEQRVLSDAEAQLFMVTLDSLQSTVPEPPPKPGPPVTCYEPRQSPEMEALTTISWRVPLLERLATTDTLHPAVLCRILGGLAKDLVEAQLVRRTFLEALKRPEAGQNAEARRMLDNLSRSIVLLEQLLGRLQKLEARVAGR